MKKILRLSAVILTLLVSLVFVPVAFAHPLGNFTINHYAGLHVSPEAISIDYVLDMAEIPAFQEIAVIDADGNGQADSAEAAGYQAAKCASLQPDLKLLVNNKSLALTLASSSVEFPAGAGGLPTLRLTCGFTAGVANAEKMTNLSFEDGSYPKRIGWREIVVTAEGVALHGDFATTSLSKRLTSYPQDLLSNPLDQRKVSLEIGSAAVNGQTPSAAATSEITSLAGSRSDAFTQLITLENLTFPTVLFALLVSFVWGAMHAMTPGHGKTVVGAYLVGSRGTTKHALYLGLTTTITHTLGVFTFGLITLFAAQYVVPEKLFPWITLLSGLFVVGIGMNLFAQRFKSSGIGGWLGKWRSSSAELQPVYSPSLQGLQYEVSHSAPPHRLVLAESHLHEHDHPHEHSHASHHHHGHDHEHDHADHSHLPPERITMRSLLALGVSGGLLPCPSALVVLLGAIALNKIGFGLILVLAFSLGLAGALTAIGMMFIYAGKIFQRFPSSGKVVNLLPAFSALFVSMIGIGIMVKALEEIGIL
jgi:ABC-type nickel/cobalt efflux system permease component RcnA